MISFELSPEEAELQRSTHRFADEHVRPLARRCEDDGEVAPALIDRFWSLGLSQIGLPERCGGIEIGVTAAVVVEEELAWGDPGVAAGVPRVASAGALLAGLRDSSSDARLTKLLRDDNRGFVGIVPATDVVSTVIDGQVALNGRMVALAAKRLEAVIVPVDLGGDSALIWLTVAAPGVAVTVDSHQLGLRSAPMVTIALDSVSIAETDILARGQSAAAALRCGLERELLFLTARLIGTARAAFDYAANYATQRTTFGRAIADHQAIAFMIADMGIQVDAARALLWNAAWQVDADAPERSSLVLGAGRFAAEHVVQMVSDAVQILGGHGYIQDHPVEKWMRDARTLANSSEAVIDYLERGRPLSA